MNLGVDLPHTKAPFPVEKNVDPEPRLQEAQILLEESILNAPSSYDDINLISRAYPPLTTEARDNSSLATAAIVCC